MPVRNQARFVGAAVESVLRQTLTDFELIVADDGSTDGTRDVVARARDDRVRLLALPRAGCVPALAAAARAARGAYLTRQDADDLSHPERLARQVGFLDAHPAYGLVGGDYRLIDAAGRPRGTVHTLLSDAQIRRTFLVDLPFCGPLVMVRRAAAEAAGGFVDARLTAFEDPDLCLRVVRRFPAANLPETIYDYRRHDANVSSASWHRRAVDARWEEIRSAAARAGSLTLPPAGEAGEISFPDDPHAAERRHRFLALRFELGFLYFEYGLPTQGRREIAAVLAEGISLSPRRRAALALSRIWPRRTARLRRWVDARRGRSFFSVS